MLLTQKFATGQSGIGYTPLDGRRGVPTSTITLGFSNMIMPVHTLRGILRTFYASITWPVRSPDLSPIEHLWDHLGRQVRQRHDVNNIRDLERVLQDPIAGH